MQQRFIGIGRRLVGGSVNKMVEGQRKEGRGKNISEKKKRESSIQALRIGEIKSVPKNVEALP